ncbi:MAG: prepilin-type N-terminal cleavage/methylation domain-containing protein [Halomonadaceae bacterium]|nr:MAG: prepilin-type N-terminal cleavage/methylation domain-containing protein [Halomonadaceae bacterium]
MHALQGRRSSAAPHACQQGITLLELMVSLVVLVVLMGFAGPSLQGLQENMERRVILLGVYQATLLAKQEAVRRNSSVTLCPLDTNNSCHGDWNQPVAVFLDPENQRQLLEDSYLLRVLPAPRRGSRRIGVGNRGFFHYGPMGIGRHTPGHVLYCPASGNPLRAGQIIINMTGKARFARDLNGDGRVQDAQGRPMVCD